MWGSLVWVDTIQHQHKIISTPSQSQRLLYKHLRNWFNNDLWKSSSSLTFLSTLYCPSTKLLNPLNFLDWYKRNDHVVKWAILISGFLACPGKSKGMLYTNSCYQMIHPNCLPQLSSQCRQPKKAKNSATSREIKFLQLKDIKKKVREFKIATLVEIFMWIFERGILAYWLSYIKKGRYK